MTAYSRDECIYPSMASCLAEFAQVFVDAAAERDSLAASHGTRAVAQAAMFPGHPLGGEDEIQQQYERLLPRAGAA